jgi:hypothetical protein
MDSGVFFGDKGFLLALHSIRSLPLVGEILRPMREQSKGVARFVQFDDNCHTYSGRLG